MVYLKSTHPTISFVLCSANEPGAVSTSWVIENYSSILVNNATKTRAKPGAALQTALSISESVSLFLPQLYGAATPTPSYKIDYFIVIQNFLNPKGQQNPISGSKVTVILLKGWILPIGEVYHEWHILSVRQQSVIAPDIWPGCLDCSAEPLIGPENLPDGGLIVHWGQGDLSAARVVLFVLKHGQSFVHLKLCKSLAGDYVPGLCLKN